MEGQETDKKIVKKVVGLYVSEGPDAVIEVFLDAMVMACAQILKAELPAYSTAQELSALFLQLSDRMSALAEDAKREIEVV